MKQYRIVRLASLGALLLLLVVGVLAQTPKPVRYVWDYTPATSNDTDLTMPSVGFATLHEPYAHVGGRNHWQLQVTLVNVGVLDLGMDSAWAEFTLWASRGAADDSVNAIRWDSIMTTDTVSILGYNEWLARFAVSASDSLWTYRFFKITAKHWDLDTNGVDNWDSDSNYVTPPHFAVELLGKYE